MRSNFTQIPILNAGLSILLEEYFIKVLQLLFNLKILLRDEYEKASGNLCLILTLPQFPFQLNLHFLIFILIQCYANHANVCKPNQHGNNLLMLK